MPDLKNLTMEEIEHLRNMQGSKWVNSISKKINKQFPNDKIQKGDMLIYFNSSLEFIRAGIAYRKVANDWRSGFGIIDGDRLSGDDGYTFRSELVPGYNGTALYFLSDDFDICKQHLELVRGEL